MARQAISRILVGIPMLASVAFVMFMLVDLTPGDPAAILAGENATPERIAAIRNELNLDDPLVIRYARWVGDALVGDFGISWLSRTPAITLIARAVGPTVSLVVVTIAISTLAGGGAGLIAALKANTIIDRGIIGVCSAAVAFPPFWIGLMLVLGVSIHLGWLPAIGYDPMSTGMWQWLRRLILPALALGALPAAELALQFRDSLIETFQRDYVVMARAKGLRERSVIVKHCVRNALIPVLTVLGYRIAQLIGGTVTIETVFVLPGLGSLAVASVFARDVPVLLGLVVITTIAVMGINLVVDLAYSVLSPRLAA